ncbi:MAG: hypothetical protein HYV32_03210 [Candidatus Kerfeldbacteria bacterium]|nr:hypothetical protein [Candidatus Kerfeldbacteria bacterium]
MVNEHQPYISHHPRGDAQKLPPRDVKEIRIRPGRRITTSDLRAGTIGYPSEYFLNFEQVREAAAERPLETFRPEQLEHITAGFPVEPPAEQYNDLATLEYKIATAKSTEDPSVPLETKRHVIMLGLNAIAEVFRDSDIPYVMYSSTALYLHLSQIRHTPEQWAAVPAALQERINDFLSRVPGDGDFAVKNVDMLRRFKDRLVRFGFFRPTYPPRTEPQKQDREIQALAKQKGMLYKDAAQEYFRIHHTEETSTDRYDTDGFVLIPGEPDVRILKGYIYVQNDQDNQVYKYPIECFAETRINTKAMQDDYTKIGGLRVLALPALQEQYIHNYDLDWRIKHHVEQAVELLTDKAHFEQLRRAEEIMSSTDRSIEMQNTQTFLRAFMEEYDLPTVEALVNFCNTFYRLEHAILVSEDRIEEASLLIEHFSTTDLQKLSLTNEQERQKELHAWQRVLKRAEAERDHYLVQRTHFLSELKEKTEKRLSNVQLIRDLLAA